MKHTDDLVVRTGVHDIESGAERRIACEMLMGVDEARTQRAPFELDDVRRSEFSGRFVADVDDDAVALDKI